MHQRKTLKELLQRKLSSQTGETLVETLVSVLIAAMSMLMLSVAIGVASNIVAQSNDAAQGYYEHSTTLAEGPGSTTVPAIKKFSSTVDVTTVGATDVTGSGKTGIPVAGVKESLPGGVVGVAYDVAPESAG